MTDKLITYDPAATLADDEEMVVFVADAAKWRRQVHQRYTGQFSTANIK